MKSASATSRAPSSCPLTSTRSTTYRISRRPSPRSTPETTWSWRSSTRRTPGRDENTWAAHFRNGASETLALGSRKLWAPKARFLLRFAAVAYTLARYDRRFIHNSEVTYGFLQDEPGACAWRFPAGHSGICHAHASGSNIGTHASPGQPSSPAARPACHRLRSRPRNPGSPHPRALPQRSGHRPVGLHHRSRHAEVPVGSRLAD